MYKNLGLSVYVSTFDTQMDMLENLKGSEYYVFTSFHIQEEFNESYVEKSKHMCDWLKENGYNIIADVSPKTLQLFGFDSILAFAQHMKTDMLRLDYGFTQEEILQVAQEYPVAFNASIVNLESAEEIVRRGIEVYGMHNFYPRPETGLDDLLFSTINKGLVHVGAKIIAFIQGDELKRGPIYEGLPTLEKHRNLPPYVAYLDLAVNFGVEGIFVGDVKVSQQQSVLIEDYIQNEVINVPVTFSVGYEHLYSKIFTIRVDSPQPIMRLQESREFSCPGQDQEVFNTIQRISGNITMDNNLYGRYSGEIQIVRNSLPQDDRVNVIGSIHPEYLDLMNCIKNGKRIRFISL